MEKQGMGRRKRELNTGLLIFLTLTFILAGGYAGADEGEILSEELPEVRIESSPANPVVNGSWTVYILVNHPNPQEVEVASPRFPSSVALERVRTATRLINGDERWTRVEFLFRPLRAGSVTLEPFRIMIPAGQLTSAGLSARFREAPAARRYEPRFRWLDPNPAVPAGERTALVLELTNWEPGKKAPEGFLQGKAPANVIFQDPLPESGGEGTYRYTIGVIPVEEGSVVFDAFSFREGLYTLNVPKLTLRALPAKNAAPVSGALAGEAAPPGASGGQDETAGAGTQNSDSPLVSPAPFPEVREKVFFLVEKEYGRIIDEARVLWDENRKAETLAALRKHERDSFSGPFLAPLRREIELGMNLELTENERWRPLRIPFALYIFFSFTILASAALLIILRPRPETPDDSLSGDNPKTVTFRRGHGFIRVVILLFLAGLALILLEEGLGNFPLGRSGSPGNAAVLKSTQSYMVPDFKGTALDFFSEGQPVIVGDYREDWCLAETSDGRSGWVRREAVITY